MADFFEGSRYLGSGDSRFVGGDSTRGAGEQGIGSAKRVSRLGQRRFGVGFGCGVGLGVGVGLGCGLGCGCGFGCGYGFGAAERQPLPAMGA